MHHFFNVIIIIQNQKTKYITTCLRVTTFLSQYIFSKKISNKHLVSLTVFIGCQHHCNEPDRKK